MLEKWPASPNKWKLFSVPKTGKIFKGPCQPELFCTQLSYVFSHSLFPKIQRKMSAFALLKTRVWTTRLEKVKKLRHPSFAVTSRSLRIWDIKVKRAAWGVTSK